MDLLLGEAIGEVFRKQQFIVKEATLELNGKIAQYVISKCRIPEEEKLAWWEGGSRKKLRDGHLKKRNNVQTAIRNRMRSKSYNLC